MKNKMEELGCDYEQGYFFSKPLPPEDFIKFMEDKKELSSLPKHAYIK